MGREIGDAGFVGLQEEKLMCRNCSAREVEKLRSPDGNRTGAFSHFRSSDMPPAEDQPGTVVKSFIGHSHSKLAPHSPERYFLCFGGGTVALTKSICTFGKLFC